MEYIFGGLALVIVLFGVSTYNGFVGLKNKLEEAEATMDVYLKKRSDLIPNLVETVKGYASHEKETLDQVMKARAQAMQATGREDKQTQEAALTSSLKSIFALSENYPELKADAGFRQLSDQLMSLENEISQSRKYFNAVVKSFNSKIGMFPGNVIAGIMNLHPYEYFMVDPLDKDPVQVKF
jgi:LemA protein